MKVIILQHISIEDPGYIKDLMIKDGAELTTIELDEGQKIPSDLSKFDAMFCMGEIGMLDINFSENKKNDLLFSKFPEKIKSLQWHSYEVQELEKNKDITLIASSPETKYQIFKYKNHAYGIQFHIEIKKTTVSEWGCVPEYKSALEKQLGEGALDKFDKDSQTHMSSMNEYSKILYENFKKLVQ